ncbi:diacylglycerol/lipid kinase family protein [Mobilicoccus massiliensis]|uniref:diacylglycerol/lipid kinase family protein n=1 Tax=Mobilicoccus massiliensis TaxID=1522310 RepID=UPI0009E2827F|nr:diacylglycerol kinase family protein [Mobilicoccus massiliensis]
MTDLALLLAQLVSLAVVATVVWTTVRIGDGFSRAETTSGSDEPAETDETVETDDPQRPKVAVVVNPTKFDDDTEVERHLRGLADEHGWELLWWRTTADDTGTGQTREAVEAGVDLVCALGGDGTVRAVAAELRNSDVPMGLLPGGTGNLLARNLGLPYDSLDDSFRIALTGVDRAIDVGVLSIVPRDTQEEPKDYHFLVMAGLGFDASVMAEAPEQLKSRIGWGAYVVSGVRQLYGNRFEAEVTFDGGKTVHRKVRSIIIGNVGRLQGGVELLPDAAVDDGCLDVVLLSPRGVMGWAAVIVRILTKTRRGHRRVEHFQCQEMTVDLAGHHVEQVQLDGDPIGPAHALTAKVLPNALVLRLPQPAPQPAHHGATGHRP